MAQRKITHPRDLGVAYLPGGGARVTWPDGFVKVYDEDTLASMVVDAIEHPETMSELSWEQLRRIIGPERWREAEAAVKLVQYADAFSSLARPGE